VRSSIAHFATEIEERRPGMTRLLRIIEPNLTGNAGHYAELVRCLALGSEHRLDRVVALGGQGIEDVSLLTHPRIERRAVFGGPDGTGEYSVLGACARDPSTPCLVLTAKAMHALALERWSWGNRPLRHMSLLFHWRETGLLKRMALLAARCPRRDVRAIAPTRQTADFLRCRGWHDVVEVPYPVLGPSSLPASFPRPARLLVAGAARLNKGIALVADLAEGLARGGDAPPMLVQTTGKRGGRHGRQEADSLERLHRCKWSGLHLDPSAPNRSMYAARFEGALVLTPYDPQKFADNVSGIALDALLHAAPIVATAGTWQAELISRFDCGIIMRDWSSTSLMTAVDEALVRWTDISRAASVAAQQLAHEHDPRHLVDAVLDR